MNSVTINGHTYTDDGNPATGMANGGHRARLIPMFSDGVITAAATAASAAAASGSSTNAAASDAAALASKNAAAASAVAAAAARDAAVAAESAVEAAGVNPAIRINPVRITANFNVPDGYNALSVGPIEPDPSVTVMGLGNSTWRGV